MPFEMAGGQPQTEMLNATWLVMATKQKSVAAPKDWISTATLLAMPLL
jgi:hypothetical protein